MKQPELEVVNFEATQAIVFSPAFETESFAELYDRFDCGEWLEAALAAAGLGAMADDSPPAPR